MGDVSILKLKRIFPISDLLIKIGINCLCANFKKFSVWETMDYFFGQSDTGISN